MTDTNRLLLKTLLNEIKTESFVPEYQSQVTDEDAMGLLISKYFEWDCLAIAKTTYNAFEDANMHGENKEIEKMIQNLEQR